MSRPGAPLLRVLVAFAIGSLVMPVSAGIVSSDLGAFVLIGVAGFVSVLVHSGWSGFLAAAAGLTAFTTVTAAMAGFSGLHFLWLALALPILAAGSACASIVHRLNAEGVLGTLRDPRAWAAAGTAVVLGGGTILFYVALVTGGSPP